MGMFDSIRVQYPLDLTPELKGLGLDWKDTVFQTKDLESLLWLYEITEDGRLMRSLSDNMFTEEEAVDANGSPIEEPRKWEPVDFHGVINFYTTHCDQKETAWNAAAKMSWEDLVQVDGNDWWIEFNAVFDNGRVRSIEVGNVEKTPVRVRLARQKEWSEQRDEKDKRLTQRIINKAREYQAYRSTIRGLLRAESHIHSFLQRTLIKL